MESVLNIHEFFNSGEIPLTITNSECPNAYPSCMIYNST